MWENGKYITKAEGMRDFFSGPGPSLVMGNFKFSCSINVYSKPKWRSRTEKLFSDPISLAGRVLSPYVIWGAVAINVRECIEPIWLNPPPKKNKKIATAFAVSRWHTLTATHSKSAIVCDSVWEDLVFFPNPFLYYFQQHIFFCSLAKLNCIYLLDHI